MAKKRASKKRIITKTITSNKGTKVKVRCKWVMQQGRRREMCFATGGSGGYQKGAIVSNRVKGKIR